MNPHELINMRGYGNAEKALRKAGKWRVTMTDTERLDWIAESTVSAKCSYDTWKFTSGQTDIDAEFIREDIDNASTAMEATT